MLFDWLYSICIWIFVPFNLFYTVNLLKKLYWTLEKVIFSPIVLFIYKELISLFLQHISVGTFTTHPC